MHIAEAIVDRVKNMKSDWLGPRLHKKLRLNYFGELSLPFSGSYFGATVHYNLRYTQEIWEIISFINFLRYNGFCRNYSAKRRPRKRESRNVLQRIKSDISRRRVKRVDYICQGSLVTLTFWKCQA